MATLNGQPINTSYSGLIKTIDNTALPLTGKVQITDGLGNASVLELGQQEASLFNPILYGGDTTLIAADVPNDKFIFSGNQDFSGATVTGLPIADPGLVNGVGTNSLKQSDALTATDAQANGNSGIALGSGAKANGEASVAFGEFAEATGTAAAAVGQYSEASALYSSAWGRTAYARSEGSVAFGQQAGVQPGFPGAVAMGRQVVGDTADTTHVRALKIVAPDGGLGGNGIIMLSPNGTAYKLTVSDAGALVITSIA